MAWKVMAGKALSASLVSCMQMTSGWTDAIHSSTRGSRAFREFTFQVAMRNIGPDPVCPCRPAGRVDRAGGRADEVWDQVADGVGGSALRTSMADARELGVTATPAWWVDDSLLIPGAQPREAIERWITKLLAKTDR